MGGGGGGWEGLGGVGRGWEGLGASGDIGLSAWGGFALRSPVLHRGFAQLEVEFLGWGVS